MALKVYTGAQHSFDSDSPLRFAEARNNLNSLAERGATTAGDPAAWADARREVERFFARYLKD